MAYLNYEQYKDLGGTAEESAFNLLSVTAENKMNYFTQGRIDSLEEKPEEVIRLEIAIIDSVLLSVISSGRDASIASYSNGIESISYNSTEEVEAQIDAKIQKLCREYLWKYPNLLYRGRR